MSELLAPSSYLAAQQPIVAQEGLPTGVKVPRITNDGMEHEVPQLICFVFGRNPNVDGIRKGVHESHASELKRARYEDGGHTVGGLHGVTRGHQISTRLPEDDDPAAYVLPFVGVQQGYMLCSGLCEIGLHGGVSPLPPIDVPDPYPDVWSPVVRPRVRRA